LPAAPGFCDIRAVGGVVKQTKGSRTSYASGTENQRRGVAEFCAKPSEGCENRERRFRWKRERHGWQFGHFAAQADGSRCGPRDGQPDTQECAWRVRRRARVIETTTDRFLDGRLRLQQPTRGFRAGLDAVVLAAAVPAEGGDSVLELGAGCGTATLCLAARV